MLPRQSLRNPIGVYEAATAPPLWYCRSRLLDPRLFVAGPPGASHPVAFGGASPLPSAHRSRKERANHGATGHRHGAARHGDGVRRARPRPEAGRRGPRHHQPRHRPARLQDPGPHRRGGGEGAPRRPPRLHARRRHPGAAGSRGRRHRPPPWPRGRPGPRGRRPRRQGDHVLRRAHVRRARRRDHLSQPGLSHLRIGDQVHRGQGRAHGTPRGHGVLLRRRGGAVADHAEHAAHHRQQPRQSDGRRRPEGTDGPAGRGPRTPSPGPRAQRRDLFAHALRQPGARQPARNTRASASG